MFEYHFNVAYQGRHLFRTDWINNEHDACGVGNVLMFKFPKSEGYKVTQVKRSLSQYRTELN